MNPILESQQTPHTSTSRVSYEMYIMMNLEEIERVLTAPRWIWLPLRTYDHFMSYGIMGNGSLTDIKVLDWDVFVCRFSTIISMAQQGMV